MQCQVYGFAVQCMETGREDMYVYLSLERAMEDLLKIKDKPGFDVTGLQPIMLMDFEKTEGKVVKFSKKDVS
jgi:hypothetical protein